MAVQNYDNSSKSEFVMHILVSFNDGTFGISTGKSFFKPKLPPKSDIEDWVTLLKSWLESKKAVAVRWPGDGICNSWNFFDYEATNCNENEKGLHNNAILKSGVIMFYSESIDEMRKERDKLILQGNEKKYLKTKDGKQKFGYPTKQPAVGKKHSINKKSVSAEKSATILQSALVDDNLLSSPLKPLEEDEISQSTETKRNQKKKSTCRPVEKSATSEVILHPDAINVNFSSPLKPLEEDEIPEPTGKKHNQKKKSISVEKSATSDIILHLAAVNNFSSPLKPLEEDDMLDSSSDDSETFISTANSSHNSDSKLSEYKKKCNTLEKENQALKDKISIIERDLEIYYNQIASKELQNMELCEKIEKMQNDQPIVLIKEMKNALAEMGHLLHNIRIQPQGHHLNQQASSAGTNVSSSARSSTGTRMKKLWGDVMVSDSCIRKIAIALKSDQMTDTCRNRIAALILDDLYTVDELANMSLSGRKCPGQDRVAKPKLPPDIVTAIHNYTLMLQRYSKCIEARCEMRHHSNSSGCASITHTRTVRVCRILS